MRRFLHLALVLVVALGAIGSAGADDGWITGRWYGALEESGRDRLEWITERRVDGTYRMETRHYDRCALKSVEIETGTWEFDGVQYTKRTLSIAGKPVDFVDVFEFDKRSERLVVYWHIQQRVELTGTKVDADFTFPTRSCATS